MSFIDGRGAPAADPPTERCLEGSGVDPRLDSEQESMSLSLGLIEEARAFLADKIRRTPVEKSPALTEKLGVPVWLKLESLQLTGSFKGVTGVGHALLHQGRSSG